jgi:hypothetical protein
MTQLKRKDGNMSQNQHGAIKERPTLKTNMKIKVTPNYLRTFTIRKTYEDGQKVK